MTLSLLTHFEVVIAVCAFLISCMTAPHFSLSLPFLPVMISVLLNYGGGYALLAIYRKALHDRNYRGSSRFSRDMTAPLCMLSLSFAFALAGGVNFFLFSTIVTLITFFHGRNMKSLGLFRNLVSAFTGSSVFILSSLYTGQTGLSLMFFSLFLFFIMAREILKDSTAMKADMDDGLHTLPLHYGMRKALTAAYLFMLAGIVIALIFNAFSDYKLLFMVIPFIMLFTFAIAHLYRHTIGIATFQRIIEAIMMLFLAGALISCLI